MVYILSQNATTSISFSRRFFIACPPPIDAPHIIIFLSFNFFFQRTVFFIPATQFQKLQLFFS